MAYVHKRPVKKVTLKGLALKSFISGALGAEPEVKVDYTYDSTGYIQACNWYSATLDSDQIEEACVEWMQAQDYTDTEIRAAKRSGRLLFTMGTIARMLLRECTLTPETMLWFQNKILKAIEVGEKIHVQRIAEQGVVNLQERSERKADAIIEEIDGFIDQFWNGQIAEVKPLEIFTKLAVKPGLIRFIADHYKTQRDDLLNNMEADCVGLDRAEKKARQISYQNSIALYNKILEACGNWNRSRVDTKPRKVTAKQAAKQALKAAKKETTVVEGLKFCTHDSESGLMSVKPKGIIGAQLLITYNRKYKLLSKYVSKEGETLNIKGTTILNYDDAKSETKRASYKSIDQIKQLTQLSRLQAIKLYGTIKGTAVALQGRTGDDTILLMTAK